MNQPVKLSLPKKQRPKGLFLFCNACDNLYAHDKIITCNCGQLVYKARVHVAGTKNNVRRKVLEAICFEQALIEFINFKKQLEGNGFQKIELSKPVSIPTRLIECFAYYMGFLNNVDVPMHKQKKREEKHIKEVDRTFGQFIMALSENGVDCAILQFTQINDMMVGFFHRYLLETLKLENKTYNNKMALLSAFTTHIILNSV